MYAIYWECVWNYVTKMILLNFHGVESRSYSIHSLLLSSKKGTPFEVLSLQWQHLVKGFMAGLHYVHEKSIIHNIN